MAIRLASDAETWSRSRARQECKIDKGNGTSKERLDENEANDRCISGQLTKFIVHHAFPVAALQLTLRPSITFSTTQQDVLREDPTYTGL